MAKFPQVELGDFRKLAPPEPARLVLSDPPYNIGHRYGPVSDRLPADDYVALMEDFATWAFAHTMDDAHLFVIHYPDFFFHHGRSVFVDHGGWTYRRSIRWCYPSNIGHSASAFTRSSRDIVWLTKGSPRLDPKADPEPYLNPNDKRVRALLANGSPGRAPYDWWLIHSQKNVGKDYEGYANQIPARLLRRVILSATMPGELVVDPFGGTGSTAKAAVALGRRGWTCDLNPNAPIHRTPVEFVEPEPVAAEVA